MEYCIIRYVVYTLKLWVKLPTPAATLLVGTTGNITWGVANKLNCHQVLVAVILTTGPIQYKDVVLPKIRSSHDCPIFILFTGKMAF